MGHSCRENNLIPFEGPVYPLEATTAFSTTNPRLMDALALELAAIARTCRGHLTHLKSAVFLFGHIPTARTLESAVFSRHAFGFGVASIPRRAASLGGLAPAPRYRDDAPKACRERWLQGKQDQDPARGRSAARTRASKSSRAATRYGPLAGPHNCLTAGSLLRRLKKCESRGSYVAACQPPI